MSPSAQPRIAVYREAQAPPVVVSVAIPFLAVAPSVSHGFGSGTPTGSALTAGEVTAKSGSSILDETHRPGDRPADGPAARPGDRPAADGAGDRFGDRPGGRAGDAQPNVTGDSSGGRGPVVAVPQLIDMLATRAYSMAREQGGVIPLTVFRELVENLVHASFTGVVITILDGGNTLIVSDQGPGIPDKEAALRPGFTSAGMEAKQYIRGVGSGFSVVRETLAGLRGELEIEDNLGRGTVVTARVPRPVENVLASGAGPAYNLTERQLKTLLLTVELAPVGPTRIAQELGVSTSTAYRDLVSLEQVGFVACRPNGHRSATDDGLAYLRSVL